jgi:hypothetical protein
VFADVDAVDQQAHQIERVERDRSPGIELRGGLRDESPTHRALARAAGADPRARRLQTAAILPRGDADQHLLSVPSFSAAQRALRSARRQAHSRRFVGLRSPSDDRILNKISIKPLAAKTPDNEPTHRAMAK